MTVILSIPKGPQQAGKGALVNEASSHSRLGHSDKNGDVEEKPLILHFIKKTLEFFKKESIINANHEGSLLWAGLFHSKGKIHLSRVAA